MMSQGQEEPLLSLKTIIDLHVRAFSKNLNNKVLSYK